mgnify:CR=1 FL=1
MSGIQTRSMSRAQASTEQPGDNVPEGDSNDLGMILNHRTGEMIPSTDELLIDLSQDGESHEENGRRNVSPIQEDDVDGNKAELLSDSSRAKHSEANGNAHDVPRPNVQIPNVDNTGSQLGQSKSCPSVFQPVNQPPVSQSVRPPMFMPHPSYMNYAPMPFQLPSQSPSNMQIQYIPVRVPSNADGQIENDAFARWSNYDILSQPIPVINSQISPKQSASNSITERPRVAEQTQPSTGNNPNHTFTNKPRVRKQKEPPIFTGDVSVDYYLDKFDEIADWNGWDDLDRAQQLRFSLSEDMEKALKGLPQSQKYHYESVKKALRQFKDDSKLTEEDFWKRNRKVSESPQLYAAELRILIRKVFAKDSAGDEHSVEDMLLKKFKSGINDSSMERWIHLSKCKTLQEAVDAAIEYESFDKSNKKPRGTCNLVEASDTQSRNSVSSTSDTGLNSIMNTMSEISAKLTTIEARQAEHTKDNQWIKSELKSLKGRTLKLETTMGYLQQNMQNSGYGGYYQSGYNNNWNRSQRQNQNRNTNRNFGNSPKFQSNSSNYSQQQTTRGFPPQTSNYQSQPVNGQSSNYSEQPHAETIPSITVSEVTDPTGTQHLN